MGRFRDPVEKLSPPEAGVGKGVLVRGTVVREITVAADDPGVVAAWVELVAVPVVELVAPMVELTAVAVAVLLTDPEPRTVLDEAVVETTVTEAAELEEVIVARGRAELVEAGTQSVALTVVVDTTVTVTILSWPMTTVGVITGLLLLEVTVEVDVEERVTVSVARVEEGRSRSTVEVGVAVEGRETVLLEEGRSGTMVEASWRR